LIVIVMGVSGSGKSYIANRLAGSTGWQFAEGDDYHSAANKAKMAASTPLTDEDRAPWLDSLHEVLANWHRNEQSGILTCSALKAAYREQLVAGLPEVRFVWLDPSREILEKRVANRPGHYMPATLLDSQLATLQPPADSPNLLHLDGTESADEELQRILAWLDAVDR
jgi:gluconokinase